MTSRGALARLIPRLHLRALHGPPTLPHVEQSHVERPFSGTRQNRYAVELMSRARGRHFLSCITSAVQMKEQGVEPNLAIYNSMLAAAAEHGFWLEAWAIIDDMLLMDIKPNVMSFNHLLHAARFKHSQIFSRILSKMEACGARPNVQTVASIVSRYVAEDNLEMAVRHLLSFSMQHLVPGHQTVQSVITLAARNNFARLALDLTTWFEQISNRRLEESVWVNCLISSAETTYVKGIERCWEIITKEFKILLDEGICTAVLNAAAANGLPSLATKALQMLQTINIPPQEHHFAAIIEAFSKKGQAKEAILVLELMSSSGVVPSIETAEPITEYIQNDVEEIDAAWKAVEQLHEEGRHLDIAIPQAIITAAIIHGDASRALAFYRALPKLGLAPGLNTYNYLLQKCIESTDRQLGDTLLADMKAGKIKTNQTTHETFIRLCLTQSFYEDAFFYLEEMKAAGYKPSSSIYTALVTKCLNSDDIRYRIALQEMEECGYIIPPSLQRHHQMRGEREALSFTQERVREDERHFIERDGLVQSLVPSSPHSY